MNLLLEYIKVFTTPQFIFGVFLVFFVILFKENIKALIDRIASIKFPGGAEVSLPQEVDTSAEKEFDVEISLPKEEDLNIPGDLKLSADQVKAVEEMFIAEKAKSYLWEYRYLNYYLVPNTQRVLEWLISLKQRPTVAFFDSFWTSSIPNASERRAILDALENHHLIAVANKLIEVTPKGKEYGEWKGKI